MEAKSCVDFSLLFCRFSCILFCCVMMPMIVIDESAYQGSIDLYFNSNSSFMGKPTSGTAIITDLDLIKVNASLPVPQHSEQDHTSPFEDSQDIEFFNWSEWLSANRFSHAVCLILTTMIFMMWQQREQVYLLQKELSCLRDEDNTKTSVLQQIRQSLDNQQSQFINTTYKMAAMNKRIDKISSELDDENSDLETMYKCLDEWKEDWISESAKIRQIHPDKLAKLQKSNDVDNIVKDQQQEIRKYISHAEVQFEKIFKYLKQDNGAITNVFDDLDYIHDVLSEH